MSPTEFVAEHDDDDDFFDPNLLQVRVESRASSPSLPGPSGLDKPVLPALNQPSAEALAEFPPAMRRIEPPRPPRGMPWGTYKAPLQEVTLTGAESLLPHNLSQLGARLIYDAFRMNPSVDEASLSLEVAHDAYINNDLPGMKLFCNLPKLLTFRHFVIVQTNS